MCEPTVQQSTEHYNAVHMMAKRRANMWKLPS